MIDEVFEIKKKLNTLNLKACLLRQDKDSGWIYFDENNPFDFSTKLIPSLENGSFILALFNDKKADSFQLAEKLLKQLLSYHRGGNFPRFLSDFPTMNSSYTGIYLYPYLIKISKNFGQFLKKELHEMIQEVLKAILLKSIELEVYKHLHALKTSMFDHPIHEVDLSKENAWAISIGVNQDLHVKMDAPVFFENGSIKLELLDFILADQKGFYRKELLNDHPLHLLLSCFYEPFEKKQINLIYPYHERFKEGLLWDNPEGEQKIISFSQKGGEILYANSSCLKIKGRLELHESFNLYFPKKMKASQFDQKGCYFLKDEPILLAGEGRNFKVLCSKNLSLVFDKREKERFEDVAKALRLEMSGDFDLEINEI